MGTRKKDRLLAEVRKLHGQINVIEDRERVNANSALVGKHFKYRNSYSCPESDADRWWLFIRVDGLDENGWPRGVKFQIDKDGRADIEPYVSMGIAGNAGYIEIRQYEYLQAVREFRRAVEAMARLPLGDSVAMKAARGKV